MTLETASNIPPVLIVGAGQAGASVAGALRKGGWRSRILLCGAEPHLPYERPPLSKAILANAESDEKIFVHPSSIYEDGSIELRLSSTVVAIDPSIKRARFGDGSEENYSICVLALGGRPRVLSELSPSRPRVHYVRTLHDAQKLRSELKRQSSLLVVGGGFLGLELASSARDLGLKVTLVESSPRLLQRALPDAASEWLAARARKQGVDLHLNAGIVSATSGTDGLRVVLTDETVIAAAVVVVAVGMIPEVDIARAAGLAINAQNGGIRVGPDCRTTSSSIYAAGDCTSQINPWIGGEVRLESWQNANLQAQTVAAAIIGEALPTNGAPWFWTDQFGWNVQIYGEFALDLKYVQRGGSPLAGTEKCLLVGHREGVIRHALAINAGGELRQLKALIEKQTIFEVETLANSALPLKALMSDTLKQEQSLSTF